MTAGLDANRFASEGYAVIGGPEIAAAKAEATAALTDMAAFISRRVLGEARGETLGDLLAHMNAAETDRAATRACYEVFPTVPEVIALINGSAFKQAARAAGLARPCAGTNPLIRLDRPRDTKFSTPAHQDWWYSMLSERAVVIWTGLGPVDPEMGPVEVIPGSHQNGVAAFRPYEAGHEWFECATPPPDSAFVATAPGPDEAVVFDQRLIHRSGANRSTRIRVSVQLRYNDLETAAAMTSTFTPSLSRWVIERQKAALETGAAS
ncbi:MAG: phytanoyl-CoA dioxygenase family protein [Oceanicaulis sp.]